MGLYIRTTIRGVYRSSLLASSTSEELTTQTNWLTGQLDFKWKKPLTLIMIPNTLWNNWMNEINVMLSKETMHVWKWHFITYFILLIGISLSIPGCIGLAADFAKGPPTGKSRPIITSSNIVLLSIGIMILFCALVSRILIASEIQSVQIRAAHLVAGKINAQLSQRVSSEFKASWNNKISPSPSITLSACYCPRNVPNEYKDDDSDGGSNEKDEDFLTPCPDSIEIQSPLPPAPHRRAFPVLHIAVGVPAFQHPLYYVRNECVFADEVDRDVTVTNVPEEGLFFPPPKVHTLETSSELLVMVKWLCRRLSGGLYQSPVLNRISFILK